MTIKERLEKIGITTGYQLSKITGICNTSAYQIINGTSIPSKSTLAMIRYMEVLYRELGEIPTV